MILNPAVVDILPALSILPTPVELVSLLNAVPAFQFHDTQELPAPVIFELKVPNVQPSVLNDFNSSLLPDLSTSASVAFGCNLLFTPLTLS